MRLRKLPLPPCASSRKPNFALIWGPEKKRNVETNSTGKKYKDKVLPFLPPPLGTAGKGGRLSVSSTRITVLEATSGEGGTAHTGRRHERVKTAIQFQNVLTQNKKLRTKSIYLMNLVQPSTPMVGLKVGQVLRGPWLEMSGVQRVEAWTTGLFETHTARLGNKATPNSSLPPSLPPLPESVLRSLLASSLLCQGLSRPTSSTILQNKAHVHRRLQWRCRSLQTY